MEKELMKIIRFTMENKINFRIDYIGEDHIDLRFIKNGKGWGHSFLNEMFFKNIGHEYFADYIINNVKENLLTVKVKTKRYIIDYGYGYACLYTPFNPEDRFNTLASTCWGIRNSITRCNIIKSDEVECEDFERLEFNGDVYVWDELGRRKMLEPYPNEEWDDSYSEECKHEQKD